MHGVFEQEVAVAPAVFLAEALIDDPQPGIVEPGSGPVTAGVVVVAADITFDDLAAYRGQPAPG